MVDETIVMTVWMSIGMVGGMAGTHIVKLMTRFWKKQKINRMLREIAALKREESDEQAKDTLKNLKREIAVP